MTPPRSVPAPLQRREIADRARRYLAKSIVEVDYYRIRQRMFFPVPASEFPEQLSLVRGLPNYPFGIWLLWELENRILSLGWHAEINGHKPAGIAAKRDLEGLCQWRRFRQVDKPDLCSSHLTRILVQALGWKWLPRESGRKIRHQLGLLVEDGLTHPFALPANNVKDLLEQGFRISNIPVIGAMGLSIAAQACRHPEAAHLTRRAETMAMTWLEWGMRGHVEGVSYDGYTADFLMDWAGGCPSSIRDRFLSHPRLRQIIDEIALLGAPTQPENLAPIGDVEPREMPFHYSFASKYLAVFPDLPLPWPENLPALVRADAIRFVSTPKSRPSGKRSVKSNACIEDAHYALTLCPPGNTKTKAVVSWSNSRMGHMQNDAGSVVIGIQDNWMLTDPGYRQYLPTAEERFTLGPTAHNHPIINGEAPSVTLTDRQFEKVESRELTAIRLKLDSTYANWKGDIRRSLYVLPGRIAVHDEITGRAIKSIAYHWHGHQDAYWNLDKGKASLALNGQTLCFSCHGHELKPGDLQRLRGSRGQLTIAKTLNFPKAQKKADVWWVFEFPDSRVTAPIDTGRLPRELSATPVAWQFA